MSDATLKELSAQLAAGACSSVELTQEYLNKINGLNKDLGCFITLDAERSLAQARAADARRAAGRAGPSRWTCSTNRAVHGLRRTWR